MKNTLIFSFILFLVLSFASPYISPILGTIPTHSTSIDCLSTQSFSLGWPRVFYEKMDFSACSGGGYTYFSSFSLVIDLIFSFYAVALFRRILNLKYLFH